MQESTNDNHNESKRVRDLVERCLMSIKLEIQLVFTNHDKMIDGLNLLSEIEKHLVEFADDVTVIATEKNP